jgi:hypothetical protein
MKLRCTRAIQAIEETVAGALAANCVAIALWTCRQTGHWRHPLRFVRHRSGLDPDDVGTLPPT